MIDHLAVVLAVAPQPAVGLADQLQFFAPLVFIMVLGYFFMIRPQQRRAREHQAQIQAVKRGDTVVLSSGVIGKVVRVEDKELGLEVAQNVTIKVVKTMIAEVRARGEPAVAGDSKS
ncbi:MAG: preprotein translocase subunit YajC [Caulobacteraceae bacterium]|nr:preprotein translocase subunit YajC [Caulobacteraceae bacterium]